MKRKMKKTNVILETMVGIVATMFAIPCAAVAVTVGPVYLVFDKIICGPKKNPLD